MPVIRCPNGTYRIGNGKCIYKTREAALKAYAGYLGAKKEQRRISGTIQEMADSDVRALIPEATYSRIKATDKTPIFKAYSLGHEGESTGSATIKDKDGDFQIRKLIKKWVKATIQMMSEKLKLGTKVFHLHGDKDNSHEGRNVIGELVGKGLEKIKGILHAIGVIYYPPEHAKNNYDICSFEGDIKFNPRQIGGKVVADDIIIEDISAITVGKSSEDSPGFPGATLQAVIQEFIKDSGGSMDLNEILEAVKNLGLNPSDIFNHDSIAADPIVKGIVKSEKASEYAARKRVEGEGTEKVTAIEKERDTAITEKTDLLKKVTKMESEKKLTSLLTDRKLDSQSTKFIRRDFDKRFIVTDPEKIDSELNTFVDSSLVEMKEVRASLGIKEEKIEKKPGDPGIEPPNLGEDPSAPPLEDREKLADPKYNPHIP